MSSLLMIIPFGNIMTAAQDYSWCTLSPICTKWFNDVSKAAAESRQPVWDYYGNVVGLMWAAQQGHHVQLWSVLFWGVCRPLEYKCSAFSCGGLPSIELCSDPLPALRQTWLTLCAAQAAAPGPNRTSPTWQPFKRPVRSSSAMTPLLAHHTHGPLQMQTARPGPVISPDLGTFICDLRRAAKNPTKPQHHPEDDAQREAGARVHRVPGKHCRETGQYRSEPPARDRSCVPYSYHFPQPRFASPPRSGSAKTGTPPDASVRWGLQLQSITAESRKSAPTCAGPPLLAPLLHRAPSAPQRHQTGPPPPLRGRRYRSSDSVFPVNAVQVSLSRSLSALFPSFSCSLSASQARLHGGAAACTRRTRSQGLAGRWRGRRGWRAWQQRGPPGWRPLVSSSLF